MKKKIGPPPFAFLFGMPMVREAEAVCVRTPADVSKHCDVLRKVEREVFHVLLLNGRNWIKHEEMVSIGTLDCALINPRDVFRCAVVHNAATIVVVHNHPSGDPTPSAEDIRVTRQLVEAGEIVDIRITDHIVLGRKREEWQKDYVSLREEGLVQFA